uniref:DUF5666 domain-containing protein n=1 Tax=mine drainage metagenome TaxID=410659 RepID=E6PYI8_9ZZZZ
MTVTLISAEQSEEFIHVNGPMEPLLTTSIPAGTYTTAAVTITGGDALCAGVSGSPATLTANVFATIQGPPPETVNLPQPIVISGALALLTLNLEVSQSVQPFSLCAAGITNQVQGLTPVFTLTSQGSMQSGLSAAPIQGLRGIIESTNGSGFHVAGNQLSTIGEFGPSWQVTTSSSTVYQGVSGASALAAGMAVEMDALISPNGVLQATRVAVYDTSTTNTALALGPVLDPRPTVMNSPVLETETSPVIPEFATYTYAGGAAFDISSQLANVAQLPFHATFNATNLVGGQNVMVIAHLSTVTRSFTPVSTMVLIPQTVDGVVTAMGTQGAFTTYTITLAPYDLFPDVASLPGSGSNALQNPNTIIVYADGSTQTQTSSAIAVGSTYRFNGLVFNDNGTLRMDCDAVYDGVAQ